LSLFAQILLCADFLALPLSVAALKILPVSGSLCDTSSIAQSERLQRSLSSNLDPSGIFWNSHSGL
jgi:hypothetical protein